MMARDPSVVVMGEDVGYVGGVFRVTDGLQRKYGEHRVLDSPISEGGIVATAIGMAVNGLKPVAEIQFADYIYPGFDQVVSELARLRYRTAGEFTSPVTIRTPCGGGIRGGQTHSQSPEAIFTHVCGIKVVMPSNPYDAKAAQRDRGMTRSSSSSQAPLQRPVRRGPAGRAERHPQGCGRLLHSADQACRGSAPGTRRSAYGTMVRGQAAGVAGIDAEIIDVPQHGCGHAVPRSARPAAAWLCEATGFQRLGRNWWPRCGSTASGTSRHPSSASPAGTPYPHAFGGNTSPDRRALRWR
jgi:2-oxoisovalerate dehydrogenase E1 component beta subunit